MTEATLALAHLITEERTEALCPTETETIEEMTTEERTDLALQITEATKDEMTETVDTVMKETDAMIDTAMTDLVLLLITEALVMIEVPYQTEIDAMIEATPLVMNVTEEMIEAPYQKEIDAMKEAP
jgi:hypothetical protein